MLVQPKLLVIHDDEKVKISDLGINPLLQESDVGKLRSEALFAGLQNLNTEVDLSVHKGDITHDLLSQFNLVIFTDNYMNIDRIFEINEYCRSQKEKIGFIYTGTLGVFGFIFVDFGNQFKIYDKDGETPKWYAISNISKSSPGEVTVDQSRPHNFKNGDFVRFSDVDGMNELNGQECRPIKVTSDYTFTIEDTREFGNYTGGGRVEEIKVPQTFYFKNLQDSLTNFTDEEFN
jgi:ubiquitin-activating enzyme E1